MKSSFTLIELIVVIAIIGILAAIIAPNAFKAIEKAKISKVCGDLKSIKTAVGALYSDTGRWGLPDNTKIDNPYGQWWVRISESQLVNNDENYAGWDGPYLESSISEHPWGGPYALWAEDQDRGSQLDLGVIVEDHGAAYDIPPGTTLSIDRMIDDGDFHAGNFREEDPGDEEGIYIIVWDAF